MVEVATGGDEGGEQLPMVLKVPHFNAPTTVCYHSYSMLGFGDILVPGKIIIIFSVKTISRKFLNENCT